MKEAGTIVVVDTSIAYVEAAVYNVDELRKLAPVELVIPFTVLSELDRLIERGGEKRDRARKALRVIEELARRGALKGPVSAGDQVTVRVASLKEEVEQAGLDPQIADDRILALAIHLAKDGARVILAAAEFALTAKATAAGLEGLYIERFAEAKTTVTRRELARFDQTWARLALSGDTWTALRRMVMFLRAPLARRILQQVRQTGTPADLAEKLTALEPIIVNTQILGNALLIFSLQAPPAVDINSKQIWEPTVFRTAVTEYRPSHSRSETDQEKSARIAMEERLRQGVDERNVDVILEWMSYTRDCVLSSIDEESG